MGVYAITELYVHAYYGELVTKHRETFFLRLSVHLWNPHSEHVLTTLDSCGKNLVCPTNSHATQALTLVLLHQSVLVIHVHVYTKDLYYLTMLLGVFTHLGHIYTTSATYCYKHWNPKANTKYTRKMMMLVASAVLKNFKVTKCSFHSSAGIFHLKH